MRRVLLIVAALGPLWVGAYAMAEDGIDRLVRLAVRAQAEDKHDQALELYTEALGAPELVTHRRAGLHSDRGVVYSRLGRIKDALDDFNEAIKLFPENPSVYNNRGSTLLAIGYDREAIKDFNRALLLAPGYAAAYLNRGSAELALRQTEAGLADYNRAVRLEPENAVVVNARGVVNLRNQRPNAAIRDFSKAIQINQRLDTAYSQRAEARLQTGDATAAVEDLSRAIVYSPQVAHFYLRRGHAYLQAADTEAAVRDFAKAIELKEAAPEAYSARGLALAMQEDFEGALSDLTRALELDQRSAESYAIRAYVYKSSEQLALAERDLAAAKRLSPNLASVRWVEGEIAEAQGARDEAVDIHKSVLAANPYYRPSIAALERLNVPKPFVPEAVVSELGLGSWTVVKAGNVYVARSDTVAGLDVMLETAGRGAPKVLDWQVRPAPHSQYGVLRYAAGVLKVGARETAYETAVVIDIPARRVMAIVPHVEGERKAQWTWSESHLEITAADGLRENIELDVKRPPVTMASGPRRRQQGFFDDAPSWVPWANNDYAPRRREATKQRRRKPKSFFESLFGN